MKTWSILAIAALSACFGLQSCTTTVQDSGDNVKVLGIHTGTHGSEWRVYKNQFKSASNKECPGGYDIIEKSYTPKALQCAQEFLPDSQFFWVIKCKDDKITNAQK